MNRIVNAGLPRAGVACLIAVVAFLSCPEASAQGWLAGGSTGIARQYDYEVGGPIDTRDDTDTAFRVFGGYMFLPVLGVALSYVDLGMPEYDGSANGGFTDELDADGYDFSLIAGWAPGTQKRLSLFGTVGLFKWSQDVHYVDNSGTYDYSDDGTSFCYGAGAEVVFGTAAKWGAHFHYQFFSDVGDEDNSGHQYDRSFISLGVDYRFGR